MQAPPGGRFPPNLPPLLFSTAFFFERIFGLDFRRVCLVQEVLEIRKLLTVSGITDLVINGTLSAQADFGDGLVEIQNPFRSPQVMTTVLTQLALNAGARLDIAKPIADFSLYGARFHAVLAQGVSAVPLLSVRKHPASQVTLDHLVETGMLSDRESDWLAEQVVAKRSILISGATSSGKTTLLRALLSGLGERVIAIEQTPELMLKPPAICLTERIANQEGAGSIGLDELVNHALRMRPDRIVVGEVRSKEFQVLLQAINNGHLGTMATIHASSLSQVAERALILGMLSGMQAELTQRLFASSIDFVLQLGRSTGKRSLEAIGKPELVDGSLRIRRVDPA
jgi:pilus assembly protein CpaF